MFECVAVSPYAESLALAVKQYSERLSDRAHRLWAKTGDSGNFLSLPQHLFDAGCVAACLWDEWASTQLKAFLSSRMGITETDARTVCVWLAAVHDIGKATRSFQAQIRFRDGADLILESLAEAGLDTTFDDLEGNAWFPHALASRIILFDWLHERSVPNGISHRLATVVDAHHGVPSMPSARRRASDILSEYPEEWLSVQREILDEVARWTGIRPILKKLSNLDAPTVVALTGLVIQADWVSSNQRGFRVGVLEDQVERLNHGMRDVELTKPWRMRDLSSDASQAFSQSFDWPEDFTPRSVQKHAFDAASKWTKPGLMIIEAPTGEGKTEAGLVAAQLLAKRTGAQGVAVAAPTMATANGLFDRVVNWAQRSAGNSEPQSLYLAHSKNRLSKGYEDLLFREIAVDSDSDGSVTAGHWYQSPKKGLLSNFVVGTIDQMLMMVLQMKHSMLRHVSLAGKVVIIDEVHSFDAYMSEYLHMLLTWFAQYRVPVILMSATLPLKKKQELIDAYRWGKGPAGNVHSTGYPLITLADESGVEEIAVPPQKDQIPISFELIPDELEFSVELLESKLSEGGCALVICNTIQRAQEAYKTIDTVFPGSVELHHSGFIASERVLKEEKLLQDLGAKSHRGEGRPELKIVVATQVAEQSLDIDADLLITDIAPIDLFIQRTGRIHRHVRPESDRPMSVRKPQVFIRGVKSSGDSPEFDPGTAFIYGEKLLISTLALFKDYGYSGVFNRPADIAPWVQTVYSRTQVEPEWNAAWELATADFETEKSEKQRKAMGYRFPVPFAANNIDALFTRLIDKSVEGKRGSAAEDEALGLAQVRDADQSIEVIVIRDSEYGYTPWNGEVDVAYSDFDELSWPVAREVAASTVRLPSKVGRFDSDFQEVIDDLERQTPESWASHSLLRGQVALRFDSHGNASAGRWKFHYSSETGLETAQVE